MLQKFNQHVHDVLHTFEVLQSVLEAYNRRSWKTTCKPANLDSGLKHLFSAIKIGVISPHL